MVYVLNFDGKPLMPCSEAKARKLLKANKAKVVKREPFAIQLLFECENQIQDINLGVDAGSKIIGLSASTNKKELFSAEVQLRNDIVDLLATRKENRRTRRNHKTRYRKSRFKNRKKDEGWLSPSIKNKIQVHLNIIKKVHEILPISKIIVEVASFDIQKIKNLNIQGEEYQQGDQLGFWNVREYVLWRDGHKCHGKKNCKNKILNIHHIESRKTGGNAPNNLITLCEECHEDYHNGILKLHLKRGQSFRDTTFMGIMRWAFYNKLKEIYSNVQITYGYITKNIRITNNFSKEHRIDALCITGNPNVERLNNWYFIKKVRNQNRQLHKNTILKGGYRKSNKATKYVFGFKLFDHVKYQNQNCFIFGRRNNGYFDIRQLNGIKISAGVGYKKLKLIERTGSYLWENNLLCYAK